MLAPPNSLTLTLTLHYSAALVRRSAFAYVRRGFGRRGLVALIVLLALAVNLWVIAPRSWAAGAVIGGAAVIVMLLVALYLGHYRLGMRKLARMGRPQAALQLCATGLHVATESGTFSAPWATVTALWQFSEFWLLILGPGQFLTLPLADLPDEAQALIVLHVPAVA